MADVKIHVLDDGPFMVKGSVEVVDGEGNRLTQKEELYLCRCGQSKSMPFCDGVHKGQFSSCIRAEKVL